MSWRDWFGRKKKSDGEIMRELRLKALQQTADSLGLSVGRDEPFSVVMDIAYPQAVVSVLSALTGDTSLYFSTGGGVLGGIQHEPVRHAGIAFVRQAAACLGHLTPTSEYPYATQDHVRFYVSTPAALLAGEAPVEALQSRQHPLSPLYYAGQEVITQLRLVSQRQGTA